RSTARVAHRLTTRNGLRICTYAFTSGRTREATALGDEAVHRGQRGGDGEPRLHGAGADPDGAPERHARHQKAEGEPTRDHHVGRPPPAFDDVTERVELALDHAPGHRNISLDLSWATSHRQVSCMEASVCCGHAMCVRRHALHASAASASSATAPPAITRCSHGVSKSAARPPATRTTMEASSAITAGTATATATATRTTRLRVSAPPSSSSSAASRTSRVASDSCRTGGEAASRRERAAMSPVGSKSRATGRGELIKILRGYPKSCEGTVWARLGNDSTR